MWKGREIKVVFAEEAEQQYQELKKAIEEEIKQGIASSEHQTLFRSIDRATTLLKGDPFIGIQIPKRNFARKYITKYGATNQWKFDLSNFWRMIYTVKNEELTIIGFILDIIDHNTYNKLFGYSKK